MCELFIADFELLDELVGDVFVDEGSRGGDACLAGVEEEVLGVVDERVFDVVVWEDQARRLAAELEDDALEVAVSL